MSKSIVDVLGSVKKNMVMQDTWGHLYPKPGSKHAGYLLIADSECSGQTIIYTDFPTLECSPMRNALERSVLDMFNWHQLGAVIYRIDCTLWFFKNSNDMYTASSFGKVIKAKLTIHHNCLRD